MYRHVFMGLLLFHAFSGLYEKIFFPEREVLGLGGRFFRVGIDFSGEKVILTETGAKPIDTGYEAPDFEASIRGSDRKFKLSENRGKADGLFSSSARLPISARRAAASDSGGYVNSRAADERTPR